MIRTGALLAIFASLLTTFAAHADIDEPPPPDQLWQGAPAQPQMWLRAELMQLPLYGTWAPHRGVERFDHTSDAGNPFHDKAAWIRRFQQMQQLRMNALVMLHYHPFPLFVDYKDRYPEAAYLTPDELQAKQEMLRWLITTADSYGIKLYFLTANIWVPATFAKAHGISQSGVDSELTRAYTRWTVAEFCRTFPGFGGLIMHSAEAPPGCADFVEKAVVAGMNDAGARMRFISWDWCSYPWQMRQVLGAYHGPKSYMSYLQYEQFFAPRADPRIGRMANLAGVSETIALGGPKSGHTDLLFANPEFIHSVMNDLYLHEMGRGIVMECLDQPCRWLAKAAFCRYAWHPTEPYSDAPWLAVIARRYGCEALARPLLTAWKAASLVLPTQMKLTHTQTGSFFPQAGLPLVNITEMGTISTYIFENSQKIGADGFIHPNMGLCLPNPDWGQRVPPIRQWVLSQLPDRTERKRRLQEWADLQRRLGFQPQPVTGDEYTPPDVVRELERHLQETRTALSEVKPLLGRATANRDELQLMLAYTEKNLALGEYYAHKDRAAIAWEHYKVFGAAADATTCADELRQSVDAWKRYAAVGDRLAPHGVFYQRSVFCTPPPWAATAYWNSYSAAERMHYADLTPQWEQEAAVVAQRLSQHLTAAERAALLPPLSDEIVPWRPDGKLLARIDCEQNADPRFHLDNGAVRTTDARLVLDGKASLFGDARTSKSEWTQYFHTDPAQVRFRPGTRYQIRLRYRVVDGGPGKYASPFAMALRSTKGGSDVGDLRTWGRPTGTVASHILTATTGNFDDYYLFLSIHGPAAIVVDDIEIEAVQ